MWDEPVARGRFLFVVMVIFAAMLISNARSAARIGQLEDRVERLEAPK